ncbi:hypothetical protein ILUMI_19715, partial [Ignelater luminosus]
MMELIASSVFFFATETAGTGGHPVLGKLVKQEFRNWKNALEVFADNQLIITPLVNFMVGQGYDGASSMSGAFHRVQVYIRAKYSSAIYVHCASHSLNLAISDACTVPQVRNSMTTLLKLCNLFRTPKRQNVFATEIEKVNLDLKKQNLKQLQEILLAQNVRNTLAEMRQNAVQEFKKIFEAAQSSCEKYGVEISVTSRQTKRDNMPHSTLEEYFRRTIFAPFVYSLILHLDERLLSHDQTLRSFAVIISSENKNQKVNEVALRQLYAVYEHLLDAESFKIVLGEVKLWYTVWKKNNKTPKTAMDVLALLLQNNTKLFLNVEALLKIIVTIAVTTASNERTISALRRLKTYLRNTTREDRLNGLALFNIHRAIPVSVDK